MKTLDVYQTSMHEFIHALGLGHTWNGKGDMICSAQQMEGQWIYTCDENARDVYPDDNRPTNFNVDAIIHMYGKDGFAAPNPGLVEHCFAYLNDMTTPGSNNFTSTSLDRTG